jgi:hypothetical protein
MTPQRLQASNPVTHPLTGPVTTVTIGQHRRHTGGFRRIREATVWGITPDTLSTQQGKTRRRR